MSSSARVSAAPISRGTLLMYFAAVALLFMPTRLRSQGASDAGWNAGSGNWGTQGNWLCDIAGSVNNPQPCVPNGNFLVGLNNGQVTLDLNISVLDVESQVNGTLTLNGTSLTTTLGAVAALGGLTLTGGASI